MSILAPATPTKPRPEPVQPVQPVSHQGTHVSKPTRKSAPKKTHHIEPKPSKFLTDLNGLRDGDKESKVSRSTGFSQAAPVTAVARDEDMTIVEDLQPGPYDHKPPVDDPLFNKFEPHSGIHLL